MNTGTFGKRLQASGLGALAFWSVHWILVGDGAWASFMWAGPLLGGGIWFQPHRAPALGPDCTPDSCPLAWLGGGVLSRHALPAQLVSSFAACAGSCGDLWLF